MNIYFVELSKSRATKSVFFFPDRPHLPSGGESIGWCTIDLQKKPKVEKSLLKIILFCWGDFFCQPLFSLPWWPRKVRSGYSWSVSLRTFDWQSAELLSEKKKKAAAVCLACANPLYIDHFPGIFWLEIGASATFLETSSQRSMCQGHLCWISVSVESQHFDLPPN